MSLVGASRNRSRSMIGSAVILVYQVEWHQRPSYESWTIIKWLRQTPYGLPRDRMTTGFLTGRETIKRITAKNDTGEYNNVRHPELTRLQSIVTQRPKEEDNNDDENGSTSDQEMEMHGARKHPGGQKGGCTIGIEAVKGRWQSRNRVSRLLSVDLGHCRSSGDGFRVVAIRTRQHDALRLVDFGTL